MRRTVSDRCPALPWVTVHPVPVILSRMTSGILVNSTGSIVNVGAQRSLQHEVIDSSRRHV